MHSDSTSLAFPADRPLTFPAPDTHHVPHIRPPRSPPITIGMQNLSPMATGTVSDIPSHATNACNAKESMSRYSPKPSSFRVDAILTR